jgi:hypothetical protein
LFASHVKISHSGSEHCYLKRLTCIFTHITCYKLRHGFWNCGSRPTLRCHGVFKGYLRHSCIRAQLWQVSNIKHRCCRKKGSCTRKNTSQKIPWLKKQFLAYYICTEMVGLFRNTQNSLRQFLLHDRHADCYFAYGLLAKTDQNSELGIWNLLRRYVQSACIRNILSVLKITTITRGGAF